MRWRFWKRPSKPVVHTPENPPAVLEDKRTYVCHGENIWGNSISREQMHDHIHRVWGWLAWAPFPRVGDELLVKQIDGSWGEYIFAEVDSTPTQGGPHDMFTGKVFGPYGYSPLVPTTKSCDEFIERKPTNGLVFFRT